VCQTGCDDIRIGFAKTDISSCIRATVGFRRPLEAVCVVMAARSQVVVLISCDVMEISPAFNRMLQDAVAGSLGTDPRNVLIHTTHTHTSPVKGTDFVSFVGLDVALSECADAARSSAVRARIKSANADVGKRLSVNRRGCADADLGIQTFWYGYRYDRDSDRADAAPLIREMRRRGLGGRPDPKPDGGPVWFDGPVDPLVHALVVSDIDGRTIGSIVRFSAHPHIASACRNRLMDPDYPARVRDEMEHRYGGVSMFLQGPSANLVPKEHIAYAVDDERGDGDVYLGATASLHPGTDDEALGEMQRIGREIAVAASAAVDEVQWQPVSRLRYAARRVAVELDPNLPDDRAQAGVLRRIVEAEYRALAESDAPLCEVRPVANLLNWLTWDPGHWEDTITADERRSGSIAMPLGALALNETVMVFLHSEITVETTIALREAYPTQNLWTVSLTGGTLNYLPPDRLIDQGGYEGRCVLAKRGSEQQMRTEVAGLLADLHAVIRTDDARDSADA